MSSPFTHDHQKDSRSGPKIAEHFLWRLHKDGRTVEARTRMVELGAELRIYSNGELLWSQVPRDGRDVGAIAERERSDYVSRGYT
jgi:hypothetical protein